MASLFFLYCNLFENLDDRKSQDLAMGFNPCFPVGALEPEVLLSGCVSPYGYHQSSR